MLHKQGNLLISLCNYDRI